MPEPPRSPPKSLTTPLLICLALVVLDVVVFAPIRHNGFTTYDDPLYVTENPFIRHGFTWSSVVWAFTTDRTGNWHPLTWLSHIADVQWFGLNAGPQHVESLLLHVVNTLLVFGVLASMTGARLRSAFVAALFGVHPLHVESVAWIAERKDVLSTVFWWFAIGAYVRWTRQPSLGRYAPLALAFALGLMAKPMVITLPVVLLLLDVWPLGRLRIDSMDGFQTGLRPRLLEKAPLIALAAASAVVTFIVQRQGGAVSSLTQLPLDQRLCNAAVSYVRYLDKMVWPARLAVHYPFPQSLELGAGLLSALAITALTVAAWRLARRAPYVLVGWLWYLVMLLPVIGLVQVGSQAFADRYTYLPLTGVFIVIAWGVPDLAGRWLRARGAAAWRPVVAVVAAIVIVACGVTARAQAAYWLDGATLWRHAIAVTSDNYVAHDALGAILVEQGHPDDGIRELQEAIAINPNFPDAHNNLGVALMRQGANAKAESAYREALRLEPDYPEAHENLALVLGREGRFDESIAEDEVALRQAPALADAETGLGSDLVGLGRFAAAIDHFRNALRLDPDQPNAHYLLGSALASLGRLDEAIPEYAEALRLDPTMAAGENATGFALFGQGKTDEAIAHYDQAIRLDPKNPAAWNNRGMAYGASRRMPEAIRDFSEAVRLSPTFAQAHTNLGLALAGTGRTAEAISEFEEVLRLDPGNRLARQALAALGRGRQ